MLLQEQLNEAEFILKAILEDKDVTSREYLIALATTYFRQKERKENDNR